MKTILGTGQSGIAVMEILQKTNPDEAITLVNRSGKLRIALSPNVRVTAADVTDKDQLEALARMSDVIFSCTDVTYELWDKFYPATSIALAHALAKTNAKLVFADNMYSYGNVSGNWMTEDMPHAATTKKGAIRAAVINTLLASGEPFGNRVAIVKAADFIGPRVHKGLFGIDFMEKLFRGGTNALSGNIKLPHTFTYIYDFATALVNVGNAADTFGQVWHAPNAPAMSLDKWVHLFEVNTDRKAKLVVLPKVIVRVAGLFNSLIKELYELAYQFEHPYLIDHAKYAGRFGDHATCPSVIVKQTVQWYKSQYSIK